VSIEQDLSSTEQISITSLTHWLFKQKCMGGVAQHTIFRFRFFPRASSK